MTQKLTDNELGSFLTAKDLYEDNPTFVKLYSIEDTRAKMFGQIVPSISDSVIMRNLRMDIVKNDLYVQNSKDFVLHRVGFLNSYTGEIIPCKYEVISFDKLLNSDESKL